MKQQISPRDWEALSAYLDGQQSPGERARLEARLQSDAELSIALAELERTRNVLRSAPHLRAPKNFTLTPAMIAPVQKSGIPLFNTFRMASALASLLFILVLIGDFTGFGAKTSTSLREAVPQQLEYAAPEEAAAPMAEAPMAAEEVPAEGAAPETFILESDAAEGGAEPSPEQAEDLAAAAPPLAEKVGEPNMVQEPTETAGGEEMPMMAMKAAEESASLDCEAPMGESQDESTICGVAEEPTGVASPSPENLEELSLPAEEVAEQGDLPTQGQPWVRILEITFGGMALVTGVAAIFLRRKIR